MKNIFMVINGKVGQEYARCIFTQTGLYLPRNMRWCRWSGAFIMTVLKPGLYEQVISKQLGEALDAFPEELSRTAPIDEAEASRVLAKYMTEIIEQGLENIKDHGGDLLSQVSLTNKIVSLIEQETKEDAFEGRSVDKRGEQLLAILDRMNGCFIGRARVPPLRNRRPASATSVTKN